MNRRQVAKRFIYAVVTNKGEIPCLARTAYDPGHELESFFSASREGARVIKREMDMYSRTQEKGKGYPYRIKKLSLQAADIVR